MEDQKTQSGSQPALETLKIKTMQDDLKKVSGQPVPLTPTIMPVPIKPPEPKLPPRPIPPAPKSFDATTASVSQNQNRPNRGEPPAHLPGVVFAPEPTGPNPIESKGGSIGPSPVAPKPTISALPIKQSAPLPPPPKPPVSTPAAPPKLPKQDEPSQNKPKPLAISPVPPTSAPAASGLYPKIAVLAAMILLIAAGAYFFWPKQEPKPTCQGEISPNCPPVSMIDNAELLTINVGNKNLDQITDEIKSDFATKTDQTAKLIALKMSSAPDIYATFDDFINLFGLNLSTQIKTNTENFNLLAHFFPVEDQDGAPKKEIRLALVLKQKDPTIIAEAMRIWEAEMIGDLMPLLLETPHDPPLNDFSTRVYNNGTFRYFSMPDYHLTINYVVANNYLIIGTSRESIFYAYDQILAAK